jgi:23S rRNA (guanine745-N1)-methyltransferase
MSIASATNLACPLDGLPLAVNDMKCVCANGHGFDIARQGYINLLPVQHKRSRHPGDRAEMVQARTVFLNSGVFAPIADRLNALTQELIAGTSSEECCVLDAGCGEGYYLAHLLTALRQSQTKNQIALIGLDISKPAILAAAKWSKQITWLIASNKQPPVLPESVDVILSLFGYPLFESFRQLLKPGGKIILVDAGPDHLIELRTIVYPTVNKSAPPDLTAAAAAGFSLREQSALTYRRTIAPNAQIMNLLLMTPHFFRASHEGKQAASELSTIEITVDTVFRVLESKLAQKEILL